MLTGSVPSRDRKGAYGHCGGRKVGGGLPSRRGSVFQREWRDSRDTSRSGFDAKRCVPRRNATESVNRQPDARGGNAYRLETDRHDALSDARENRTEDGEIRAFV